MCHRDDYQANYHTLTLQSDIYGQNADSNTKVFFINLFHFTYTLYPIKSDTPIVQFLKYGRNSIKTINFIVVGPITEYSDVVTSMYSYFFMYKIVLPFLLLANILLQKLYRKNKYFNEKAVLLAIRPLRIGFKQCSKHFIQYKPPRG